MLKSSIIAGVSIIALTGTALAADQGPRPMFAYGINRHDPVPGALPAGGLPTWNFKWSYSGTAYHAIFVGAKPKTGTSTTVPVYIIPIKLTYGSTTEDPTKKDFSGNSPVTNTVNSPIFQTGIDWVENGVDLGNTQFEDAFQRANLWGTVKKHTGYHVLLGQPTVEPVQAVTVPAGDGSIGSISQWNLSKVIIANINWFDPVIEGMLTSLKIPANSLPIFVTTQAYLSSDGTINTCCIGGYHSYNGTQAYSDFTYISNSSKTVLSFSQDISALSHEAGEWLDDPLTNNTDVPSSCGTNGNHSRIYEVGDPIEVDTNFGDFTQVFNGFTYHIQDLVMPSYFGAPESVTDGYNQSFKGLKFSVCQNGG